MDPLLIAVRALHFAGAISLTGVVGFAAVVVGAMTPALRQRLVRLAWFSLALTLLAAPLWLLVVAAGMSGSGMGTALANGAAITVLTETQFGRALMARSLLLLLVFPCVAILGRRRLSDATATVIAAASLAGIAWQGHAGAGLGWSGTIHLAADTAHLVAAGLWLGALLPLALSLREPSAITDCDTIARRFSSLGAACVAVLLISGVVNAWYLVGSIPALFGTPYGQTLLVKLAFVAAILGLAAVNRWRLVPRLAKANDRDAAKRLARHSIIEAALGLGVIAIVAALGVMMPPDHEALVALSSRIEAFATGGFAVLGLALLISGIWRRRLWAVILGALLILGLGWRPIELLAVAATRTSSVVSPEPFTAANLATVDAPVRVVAAELPVARAGHFHHG